MSITLLIGDCRAVLATLPDKSVQTCVTSPPYYGLRDYGNPGQIGLEATPAEYVAALVAVFEEVKRVLRDDGTCWVNLGDSYAAGGMSNPSVRSTLGGGKDRGAAGYSISRDVPPGLKPKDLIGIPWMVAFALRDAGWYLRSAITWCKGNAMPESVRDRPTSATEMIFLLAKNERYFYDADAIAEPAAKGAAGSTFTNGKTGINGMGRVGQGERVENATRNKRNWWQVNSTPYAGAHFATFPEKLIEPCILAGSMAVGGYDPDDLISTPIGDGDREGDPSFVTGRAGFNRPRRAYEATRSMSRREQAAYAEMLRASPYRAEMAGEAGSTTFDHYVRTDRSGARAIPPDLLDAWIDRGWLSRIELPPRPADPSRSVVLDPFVGSGTTCRVAERLGRDSIGIDLGYTELQEQRTDGIQKAMVDLL